VEIYLAPTPRAYYHLVANAAGVRYDGKGMDKAWNGDWTAATTVGTDSWTLEVRIPYDTLDGAEPPDPGSSWGFNIARNDRINSQYATWAPLTRAFHEPENFGRIRFLSQSFGVTASALVREGRTVRWRVAVTEPPSDPPLTVRLAMRSPGGDASLEETLTPAPGGPAELTLEAPAAWLPRTSVWRSITVARDGRPVLAPAPVIVPADAILPERTAGPDPVTIANTTVSLTFDRTSGRLLTAANLESGLKLDFTPTGLPIAEIDGVSFLRNPRFFSNEDVRTLVPDYDSLENAGRDTGDFGERLRLRYGLEGGLDVLLTITVPPAGTETQWDIELNNRPTTRPSRSLVVHRVRYPSFDGVADTACGAQPYVVIPNKMGQRFPDPGRTLGRARPFPYIGPTTMGWFDFYGADGGLCVKVGDVDPLPETHFILQSDPDTRRLTLAVQRWALCWPGERWAPGPCGVAPHAGDWHAAADLYRTWFRNTFTQHPRPDWLVEADGYVMSGGPSYEFGQLPRILENAKAIGIDYIQLWSEMTGGELSYHVFAFPNPYMGTENELKKAIRQLHKQGGHIGVYLNFNTGDPLLGTFVRQPRLAQKIPDSIPRPARDYMSDNWVQQSLMDHTGSYSMWSTTVPGYLDDYWNTCPAGDKWTDFYYFWSIEKWAKDYDLDVWYLDSCPVSRGSPCFASDHGHERPAPEGQAIIDFVKRMREGAPRGFCIMQEYSSDRLLQYGTHALGLMWHGKFAHPEVVRYTLPEYPLFSGMCNGNAGLQQFYPGEKLGPRDAIERVFLIGNRFEFPLSHRPPQLADDWKRRMVALRRACHPEMSIGDFLDNVGLGRTPDRVHARWFRHPQRTRLVIALLDRRGDDAEPWDLQADLKQAGVSGGVRRAWMKTLDGQHEVQVTSREDGTVSLRVPPVADRAAAIFLEIE
jgi:hypothetical protein